MSGSLNIRRILTVVMSILLGVVVYYFYLPALNLRSLEGLYFIWFIITLILVITFPNIPTNNSILIRIVAIVGGFLLILLLAVVSGPLIQTSAYQSLIDIEEGDFKNEVASNNIDEIAVVDVATAQRLGDRTIASLKNSSWYDVDDEYNLILYKGKQYRISPLTYGGFFKYLSASSSGIPGYVLVDAITQEATLVQTEKPIYYSPSASFFNKLSRHLRIQYPFYVLGKSFFEIDEDGNPYWVTSVKNPKVGFCGGFTKDSFIITDATTGESQEVSTDELPSWIDHAFDLAYLMKLVNYNYEYIHGYFNFSKTDVNQTTYESRDENFDGYNTTISSDGIVFYSGVTPANASNSITGFVFANPRTGKVKFYPATGANESSAQTAAQGLVQDLKYTATFPIIVNIDGNPTYFMTLKDQSGLIQRYAFSNVENYSITVQAFTLEEALDSYRKEMGGSTASESDTNEVSSTTGQITNIYTAEIDGYTYFYFTLASDNNLYMSSIENSNRQVLLQVGTNVTIKFTPSSESGVCLVQEISF